VHGFLYVLDSAGEPLKGWPVQMGEIQGQPLVADLNGDGYMEVRKFVTAITLKLQSRMSKT
jgi:hypothetical protein